MPSASGSDPSDVRRPDCAGSPRHWEYLYLALLLSFLVASSWSWMTRLGMENDEAHFLPAAVKIAFGSPEREPFPSGIYVLNRPFPFMTAAYIGALDAYLYGLVFAVFGFSPLTFRLTNVVLSAALLISAYTLARNTAGRVAAVLASLLLVFDLEYLLHAPTNYGPIHIQMLCATIAVLMIQNWMASRKLRPFVLAAFLLGLAFSEKLTFVWFFAALLLCLALFHGRSVLGGLRPKSVFAGGAAFLLGSLPVLIYTLGNPAIVLGYGRSSAAALPDWGGLINAKYHQFKALVSGEGTLFFMAMTPPPVARFSAVWWGLWFVLGCMAAGLVIRPLRRQDHTRTFLRSCGFFLCLSAFVVIFSSFFREAGKPHHLMLTYPFIHVAVAVAGAWVLMLTEPWKRPRRIALLACLVAPILASGVSSFVSLRWLSREAAKTGGRLVWSSEIYDLAAWVRSMPRHHFVFSSWGLYRIVFSFSEGACSCRENYFQLLPTVLPVAVSQDLEAAVRRQRSVVVFSRIFADYTQIRGHVFEAARRQGLTPRLLKEFHHPTDGNVLYEAYSFSTEREIQWRQAEATEVSLVHQNMEEASLATPGLLELQVSGVAKEVGGLLGIAMPVRHPSNYLCFRARSLDWTKFDRLTIRLVAESGKTLQMWQRTFAWFPSTRPEMEVEVGPDLYPAYFSQSLGGSGPPSRFIIFLEVRPGSETAAVSIAGLEIGSQKPATAQ
mgnify:CR=1 FL=1